MEKEVSSAIPADSAKVKKERLPRIAGSAELSERTRGHHARPSAQQDKLVAKRAPSARHLGMPSGARRGAGMDVVLHVPALVRSPQRRSGCFDLWTSSPLRVVGIYLLSPPGSARRSQGILVALLVLRRSVSQAVTGSARSALK